MSEEGKKTTTTNKKKPVRKMDQEQAKKGQESAEETKQEPNALLISLDLAEKIVGYLRNQKMSEVEGLVKGIRESRAYTVKQD
jgi:hypothetical protein